MLWTRLAPEPLRADGGMEPRPVEVRWEVAKDPSMRRLVRRGRTTAWPSFAHSVHVEVDGLDDGREYFYRFTTGSAASPVGRTRTAPRGRVNELTFSFVSCQKWDDGFYPAYREIAREDHDFVMHLGDYTYEYGIANDTGPRNPNLPPEFVTETETLERYRLQHALYKTDPHLQAAHRAHPFIVVWDDHEVQNDYTGRPVLVPPPRQRLPRVLRAPADAPGVDPARQGHADLPQGHVGRPGRVQHARHAAVPRQPAERVRRSRTLPGGVRAPSYTMLGPAQEQWLLKNLKRSDARWNFIGNQVLMAELDHDGHAPGDDLFWNDSWDGYPGGPQPHHEVPQGRADPEPRDPHRRLALDVRQRRQGRTTRTRARRPWRPSSSPRR